MGNGVSVSAFDPAHVRIYQNILQLQSPQTRVQMIQTCLAGIEYTQTAKRAGVYSYLLNYMSTVQNGGQPPVLPGENGANGVTNGVAGQHHTQHHTQQQQQYQQQQQPIPRTLMNNFQNPVVYPKPEINTRKVTGQLTNYAEPKQNAWTAITQTPQQKMVSYFSSCLEVLGIQEEVTLTEEALKKAYKRASLKAHPDKGGSEEQFEAVTRAFAYLTEILKRLQGGRAGGLKEVAAPEQLTSGRSEESKAWQHVEPVKLNPKNLNLTAFNQMFEKTHMVDPDNDGYGDWLKDEGVTDSSDKFKGKFNRDVFNKMFDESARKQGASRPSNALIHPEAMALTLAPSMGLELGRERPDTFTPAPNSKQQFSDLMDAYSREATISDKVSNVRVENRSIDAYRANREKGPDPFTDQERAQMYEAEKQIKQREQQRQVRAAGQGVLEQQYFDRMKQLVITDRQ
uniref:J domain-containing protein n=1 Tax=viral metagenome TaxID=1070528 RepID=A0A6C0AP93_9ZZZZ